jgi:hypothetical protein
MNRDASGIKTLASVRVAALVLDDQGKFTLRANAPEKNAYENPDRAYRKHPSTREID